MTEQEARVLRLSNGVRGFLGVAGGVGLVNGEPGRPRPQRLGLNDPFIAREVRVRAGEAGTRASDGVRGAGMTMVPRTAWREWTGNAELAAFSEGAVLLAYVRRRLDMAGPTFREVGAELFLFLALPDGGAHRRLGAEASATLMRLIRRPRPKRQRPTGLASSPIVELEARLAAKLGTAEPGRPAVGVFPLAAVWIEPADE